MNILTLIAPLTRHAHIDKTQEVPIVELSHQSEESYYEVARLIMKGVNYILKPLGLEHNNFIFISVYAILVFLIAWAIGEAVKVIILFIVHHLSKFVKYDLYGRLKEAHFFEKICSVIAPVVFLIFIQFTLTGQATLALWLSKLTWIYICFRICVALSTLSMVIWNHVDARENKRKLPLKGIVQLIKGMLWIIFTIVVMGIIVNKSPASLLAGLGAFAAVLMLVFKDSILGVVAGVQLSENDSLHVGDWIKVPGTDANGNVVEVTLTSVKVQNFDKTVTTIPPYNLISGSFTNYRQMQITGTRRICRNYMIDADSVVPADDIMLERYSHIPLLSDWLKKKIEQRAEGKTEDALNSAGLVDGSIETNLGIFRAYLKLYLDAHPNISHASADTCFISTLPQTAVGIPLQIYCFTSTSQWTPYEAIQSSIFEHIAIAMGRFGLYTNENASGRDEILNGVLEAGKDPARYFGIPFPFLSAGGTPDAPAIGNDSNLINTKSDNHPDSSNTANTGGTISDSTGKPTPGNAAPHNT